MSVPQMEFFHEAQYDGIILGNHDFDRHETALFTMFDKANDMKLSINVIVSNLVPLPKDSNFQAFYEHTSSVKFIPYLIKRTTKGKVGVLGYMTPDALFVSNDYRLDLQFVGYSYNEGKNYESLLELAANQSSMLKTQLKCDIVVAVIHGGHKDNEDVGLLNLPDIDIVLGGHTHESYFYSSDDSSLTSQCGYSGMTLTALSIGIDTNRRLHFKGVDEEYSQLIYVEHPQCIRVTSDLKSDAEFEKKIQFWKQEIKDLLEIEQDKIVFRGNITPLLQRSSSREYNAWVFAHMLVDQFNKWERKSKLESEPVTVTFWNKDFFQHDQLNHDLSDVTLTFDDAYSLIFLPATKDLYTFFVTKEEIYYVLQGMFIMNKLVSPLLTVSAGGILYSETSYIGIPVITDVRTVKEVPYRDWPSMVRVLTNSVSAPYFWKIKTLSHGLMDIIPKDKNGTPIDMSEAIEKDSPKELDLFLNYLVSLNEA